MDNTQRDTQIAAEYMRGVTVPKLAIDFGLSIPTINRLLAAQDVDRSKRLKSTNVDKAIDHTHEIVGQRLYNYRSFTVFEDRIKGAENLGWSAKRLAQIEKGHSVLTLIELNDIALYMQLTLSQLLEDL